MRKTGPERNGENPFDIETETEKRRETSSGRTHCGRGLPDASHSSTTRSWVLYANSFSGLTIITGGTSSAYRVRVVNANAKAHNT